MEHILAILLGLVVGYRIAAVTVAVIAPPIDVAMLQNAGAQRRGIGTVVYYRIGVKISRGELAVFVAPARFDVGVAEKQAASGTVVWRNCYGIGACR